MGVRETPVRTLGGEVVTARSPYAMAKVQGGSRATRGPQGTGVYPVLDELDCRAEHAGVAVVG